MHLVHVSSNLMNKTMHPELAQYVCRLSFLDVSQVCDVVSQRVDLGTAVRVCSPCRRLYIAVAVMINSTACCDHEVYSVIIYLLHQKVATKCKRKTHKNT